MINLKVAIVHDWLLGMRGGERCLEMFLKIFPEADIFTAFYNRENLSSEINSKVLQSSSLHKFPFSSKYHRYLLPLYPFAARSLSTALERKNSEVDYDLVISVSHCLAKNVRVPQGKYHLCYCLTPVRYLWDQYDAYFANSRIEPVARRVVKNLRRWDVDGVENVDSFVAISDYVAKRIKRVYQRDSKVIYPPVRTDWITPREEGEMGDGFLCASAFVPYKRIDSIVKAFGKLPYKLKVVGEGPELPKIRSIAGSNIEFVGRVSDEDLADLYRQSRALIFAAEEDFGMIPVEMQAAGRPVICLGKGGALETVVNGGESKTGLYFTEATPEAIALAVEQFVVVEDEFTVNNCVNYARNFSTQRFENDLFDLLQDQGVIAKNAKKAFATI